MDDRQGAARYAVHPPAPREEDVREERERVTLRVPAPLEFDPDGPTPVARPASAVELVARSAMTRRRVDLDGLARDMFALFLEDDNVGALAFAEEILKHEPEHLFAELVASQARTALRQTSALRNATATWRL